MNPMLPHPIIFDVAAAKQTPSSSVDEASLPTSTYEEIWERDARWLLGPGFLSDVVAWVRYNHFTVQIDQRDPCKIDLVSPMPHMITTDGEAVPASTFVPAELRAIFEDRWSLAMTLYGNPLLAELTCMLWKPITAATILEMQSLIWRGDTRRKALGMPALDEIVAACFGFHSDLPRGAGFEFVAAP